MNGFEKLRRTLDEIKRALANLDGELAVAQLDPHDPADIERAIQSMNDAIDHKLAGFGHNPAVVQIGEAAKEQARGALLQRAAAARIADES